MKGDFLVGDRVKYTGHSAGCLEVRQGVGIIKSWFERTFEVGWNVQFESGLQTCYPQNLTLVSRGVETTLFKRSKKCLK